jgi:hypothetical protein
MEVGRWTLDCVRCTVCVGRWTLDAGRWMLYTARCTLYNAQVSTVVDYMFLYTSMALYGGLVTRQRDRYLTPDLR